MSHNCLAEDAMNDHTQPSANAATTAGQRFRQALAAASPLAIVGATDPYCAMMAARVGHQALKLAGVGPYAHGLPDLGITTANDLLGALRRMTDACELPVMVDAETGFGSELNIARLVKGLIKDGAAAMHIEDQVPLKRCGHLPGKALVPTGEMLDRLKAALDARTDASFFICARTDALAVEGLSAAIDRACAYRDAGADMILPEACSELGQYRAFVDALDRPHSVVAALSEFSKTPAFTLDELRGAGVSAAIFSLSAGRAMAAAALKVYQAILRDGSAKNVIDMMQTREELYDFLGYHEYEEKADRILAGKSES
jgi:methylisocitrate lyase